MNIQKQKNNANISEATYRYETVVKNVATPNYTIDRSFVRTLKIFNLGLKNNVSHFYIICVKHIFSNEDNSDVVLLKKLSYLWDEIEICVSKENLIIKILNIEDLVLKWKSMKDVLFEDYKGAAIENYFNTVDDLLKYDEELCGFLNTYKMFGLLFNGQYGGYDVEGKKTRVISEDKKNLTESILLIKKENVTKVKIQFHQIHQTDVDKYDGLFFYENNHLTEAFLHFEREDKQTKYSLSWIG